MNAGDSVARDLRGLAVGDVRADAPSRRAYSRDFGGLVRRHPLVVVRPGRVSDVARVLRYASAARLPVTARGAGHSQSGQSLSDDGIVVDLRALHGVSAIDERAPRAHCLAGTTWLELLRATLPVGLVPPVLTDNAFTTVGGTHAVGGVGSASYRHGMQIDQCDGLTLALASGDVMSCSDAYNTDAFELSLGGLGQLGIVTNVSLRLRPMGGDVLSLTLRDLHPEVLFDAARSALQASDATTAHLAARWRDGAWRPVLGATAPARTDAARALLAIGAATPVARRRAVERTPPVHLDACLGLHGSPSTRPLPVTDTLAAERPAAPSVEAFLPVDAARATFAELCALPLADCFSAGVLIVLFLDRTTLTRPLATMPAARDLALVGFYPIIAAGREVDGKRTVLDVATRLVRRGGTRYLPGLLSDDHDWAAQFADHWERFRDMKRALDP